MADLNDPSRGGHGRGDLVPAGRGDLVPAARPTKWRKSPHAEGARSDDLDDAAPLHDLDAEKAVLGAVLLGAVHADAGVLDLVRTIIRGDDFYHPAHRVIFECMLSLAERGDKIDIVTLNAELRAIDRINAVGGLQYLGELTECTPTIAHAEQHARIVLTMANARRLESVARQTIADLRGRECTVDEALAKAQAGFVSGMRDGGRQTVDRLSDLVARKYDVIESRARGEPVVPPLSTGFAPIDEALGGGWERTWMIVVGARPAMGKSSFVLQSALHMATTGQWVAYFSFEMSNAENLNRLLSSRSGVPLAAIKANEFTEEQMDKFNRAAAEVYNWPLYLIDDAPNTLAGVRSRLQRLRMLHKGESPGLIVIDYAQLLEAERHERESNREAVVSHNSRGLKKLAREYNAPVIAVAQLNRSLESRADKRPMLSDLRESGSLEQDANLVMFLYRDEVYNKDTADKGIAEAIIAKQRDGQTGTVRLGWQGDRTSFYALAENDPRSSPPQTYGPSGGRRSSKRRAHGAGASPFGDSDDGGETDF